MRGTRTQFIHLFVLAALSSCTVDLAQPSNASLPTEPAPVPSTTTPEISNIPFIETRNVPVTWGGLGLSGRLVYLHSTSESGDLSASIQVLDLSSGEVGTVFRAAEDAWIFYMDVSPDGKQAVLSYIDPAQPGASSNRALYLLPLDGSSPPQLLFTPPSPDDHYTQAEWSPDGKYIYYSHYNSEVEFIDPLTPDYGIYRMGLPQGNSERIIEHAFWPRLSPDSTRIAYISLAAEGGKNEVHVANADGSDPIAVVPFTSIEAEILDAPIFTPDGRTILFSVPSPAESYQPNWLDILSGVRVASAHNVPSDWWSVPVSGGEPRRLTQLHTVNLFASLLPDGRRIASLSGEGLFTMEFDGSSLTRLLPDPGIYGSLRWLP